MDIVWVTVASFGAGLVDAVVGGGGLILLPALFATFPQALPATLLGTNKSASIWGTSVAFAQYQRRVQLRWASLAPAALASFIGSFAGAWAVTQMAPTYLRLLLPLMLLVLLIYTLARKDLGRSHAPRWQGRQELLVALPLGLLIGFYDGFFGPGTGSFLVFAYVRVLGYDFLNASASAKLINVSTNLAAVLLFASKGHIWWQVGLVMAAANVLGSLLGTRLALQHGAGFVRGAFIVVVTGLIVKTGFDAWSLWPALRAAP